MTVVDASIHFLDFDSSEGGVPAQMEELFLSYAPEKWRLGSGDGVFVFTDEVHGFSSLYVIDDGVKFISVRYNHREKGDRRGVEFYSLGSPETINEIIDVGEDQFIPVGSLIEPVAAWQVLNEFLSRPHELPKSVDWISSNQISWPSDW